MRLRSRDGFSLVEGMVAMILLSVSLMALAPVLFQAIDRQRTETFRLERTGVLLAQSNRLMALPFDELDSETDLSISDPYVHTYDVDIDVTVAGAGERLVKVVVIPDAVGVGADSIQFSRAQP